MSYNQINLSSHEASWGFAFAQRLKDYLKDQDMTLKEFMRRTGIPESSVKSYLDGRSIPNYYRMTLIAQAFGVSVDRLVDLSPGADLYTDLDDEDEDEDWDEEDWDRWDDSDDDEDDCY